MNLAIRLILLFFSICIFTASCVPKPNVRLTPSIKSQIQNLNVILVDQPKVIRIERRYYSRKSLRVTAIPSRGRTLFFAQPDVSYHKEKASPESIRLRLSLLKIIKGNEISSHNFMLAKENFETLRKIKNVSVASIDGDSIKKLKRTIYSNQRNVYLVLKFSFVIYSDLKMAGVIVRYQMITGNEAFSKYAKETDSGMYLLMQGNINQNYSLLKRDVANNQLSSYWLKNHAKNYRHAITTTVSLALRDLVNKIRD